MSTTFSANEAAAELGVNPRILRRFLRTDSSWHAAGQGGRYSFTKAEVTALGKALAKYRTGEAPKRRAPKGDDTFLNDPPARTPEDLARRITPAERQAAQQRRAHRQQRLQRRLDELFPATADKPAGIAPRTQAERAATWPGRAGVA